MKPTSITRSLVTLPKAVASCSAQATAYGQCINSNYTDVSKNMCKESFEAFKACVSKAMKK